MKIFFIVQMNLAAATGRFRKYHGALNCRLIKIFAIAVLYVNKFVVERTHGSIYQQPSPDKNAIKDSSNHPKFVYIGSDFHEFNLETGVMRMINQML